MDVSLEKLFTICAQKWVANTSYHYQTAFILYCLYNSSILLNLLSNRWHE